MDLYPRVGLPPFFQPSTRKGAYNMSYYFGVMPQFIRHNKDIKPFSKVLYSEILACLNDDGQCVKRNAHFKKVLGISTSTLSSGLTELRRNGFISVDIYLEKGTEKFIKRYITPIVFSGGVNQLVNSTHANNQIGVSNGSPQGNAKDPSEYQATLLYNNNDINKVYINNDKSVPILDELNDRQIEYLRNIVDDFYNEKNIHFPEVIKNDWHKDEALVNDSINTLYMIIKLDDYSEEVVRDVLRWAVNDKFWHSNLISLRGLRKKSNNGQTKFTNIYLKYKGRK